MLTERLPRLGYSTDTLRNPTKEAQDFVRAFETAMQIGAKTAHLGPVQFLVPNPQMKEAQKIIRSFIERYLQKAINEKRTQPKERSYGTLML